MSTSTNQRFQRWDEVSEFLTTTSSFFYTGTKKVSHRDKLIIQDALLLWYLCTEDTLSSGENPHPWDKNAWLNAITQCPVKDLVVTLKDGAMMLITSDIPSYDSFKRSLKVTIPTIGDIISPMKGLIDRWLMETDVSALTSLYSWFLFLSHLHLQDADDLKQEALEKYLLTESSLKLDGFSVEEKNLIGRWFPRTLENAEFFCVNHVPGHGPGSTADCGRTMIDKYLGYRVDARLTMLRSRVGGFPLSPRISSGLARCSKTIFVPKSVSSLRTISMEPASLMWHQKGVRNALLLFISNKSKYLGRRLHFDDQSFNRDLAWEGSIDGSYATIDLSSASDTVSWPLVKEWFGHTCLYPWLLWTRSNLSRLPNGEVITLRKFAPMGSDLSFPIESIIFSAVTECAIMECGADPSRSRFVVYGDDIVVESEYAEQVMYGLLTVASLSMMTNHSQVHNHEDSLENHVVGTTSTASIWHQ